MLPHSLCCYFCKVCCNIFPFPNFTNSFSEISKFFVYLFNAFYWPIFLLPPLQQLLLHEMAWRAACFMLLLVSCAIVNGPPYKLHARTLTPIYTCIQMRASTIPPQGICIWLWFLLRSPFNSLACLLQFIQCGTAPRAPLRSSALIRYNWHFEFIFCYYFFNKCNLLTASPHSRAKGCLVFLVVVVVLYGTAFLTRLNAFCGGV